jgi:hypothetical protein
MNNLKVIHWTGAFGIAVFVLVLLEFPLWGVGNPPPLNAIPAMYGGTLDPTRFYNALGWGPIISLAPSLRSSGS